MGYLALYRKYRPVDFNSVYGQEEVVTVIKNAIVSGKVSHAYLLFPGKYFLYLGKYFHFFL